MADLTGIQDVRLRGGGTEPAAEHTVLYGKENDSHELGTVLFVNKGIISTVKMAEFVSDRMSFLILNGHSCDIIVRNVCASSRG
jgi:hypothetical protein